MGILSRRRHWLLSRRASEEQLRNISSLHDRRGGKALATECEEMRLSGFELLGFESQSDA